MDATSPVQVATVRPGALGSRRPRAAGPVETRRLAVEGRSRVRVRSRTRDEELGALGRAVTVVGVGLGVDRDDYPGLAPLLEELGAELAATRPVTDRGWQPPGRQVGLTGRAVAPRLYVAVGVRGAFEHMVGVAGAGTVLAVYGSRDAPVFDAADVGIVGDWRTVTPRLVAALHRAGATPDG